MDNDLQSAVGKKIRRLRLESGLTIEELAFRARLHPNYLGDIERGRRNPSLQNLQKIAQGLKKYPADLLPSAKDAPATPAADKPRDYFYPAADKETLALLKALKCNTDKDRHYIISMARSLSSRLR